MITKLTLTLEKEVIEEAKSVAREKGQSLSELVENYFKLLIKRTPADEEHQLSEKVASLRGTLKVDDDFDYKSILEEELMKKYGS